MASALKPRRKTFSVAVGRMAVQCSPLREGRKGASISVVTKTPVTIRDVARLAGVSVGTVSKALNGYGQLREQTRDAVRNAAERLGFRPNDLAQSLLRKRSFTVGLISTDSYGRFSIPVLEGIESALEPTRLSVFLCRADDPVRERRHVDSLLAKRVDGIIVTGRRTDRRSPLDLGGASVPVVYAFAQVADPRALCLLPDDRGGARLAVDHLIELGRRRIAHVTGPVDFEAVRKRRQGFRDALAAAGLRGRAGHVLTGAWSEAFGREAAQHLAGLRPAIDAIFCGSDQIARGVIDSLRETGVRVPDDLAVVGFDNWDVIAAATRPPITTVDMNLHELGRQAGLRLLDMIDGPRPSGVECLPCRLVVRQSCGAASGAAANVLQEHHDGAYPA
jgi:LacI family transcriptional regulator